MEVEQEKRRRECEREERLSASSTKQQRRQIRSSDSSPPGSPAKKRPRSAVVSLVRSNRSRTYAFPPSQTNHGEKCNVETLSEGRRRTCTTLAAIQTFADSRMEEVEMRLSGMVEEMTSTKLATVKSDICRQIAEIRSRDQAVSMELERVWFATLSQIEEHVRQKMEEVQQQAVTHNKALRVEMEVRLMNVQCRVDEILRNAREKALQIEDSGDCEGDTCRGNERTAALLAAALPAYTVEHEAEDTHMNYVKYSSDANEELQLEAFQETAANVVEKDIIGDKETEVEGAAKTGELQKAPVPVTTFQSESAFASRQEAVEEIAPACNLGSFSRSSSESAMDSKKLGFPHLQADSWTPYVDMQGEDDESDDGPSRRQYFGEDDMCGDNGVGADCIDAKSNNDCSDTSSPEEASPLVSSDADTENSSESDEPSSSSDVISQLNDMHPLAISEISAPVGCFVDGGAGLLLAGVDGVCRFYDAVSWKKKCQFVIPENFNLGCPGGCWLLSTQWHDSEDMPIVIVVSRDSPAFYSWNFETGATVGCWAGSDLEIESVGDSLVQPRTPSQEVERMDLNELPDDSEATKVVSHEGYLLEILRAMEIHKQEVGTDVNNGDVERGSRESMDEVSAPTSLRNEVDETYTSWKDVQRRLWWARPSGPILAVASAGKRTIQLVDVRDGQVLLRLQLNRPIEGLKYSSPIQWIERRKLAVAEEGAVELWDTSGGKARLVKSIPLPEAGTEKITAMACVEAESSSNQRGQSWSDCSLAFSTEVALYLVNWHLPDSVKLRIPHNQFHPPDILFLDSDYLYAGVQGTARLEHTRILKWSCQTGNLLECFPMAEERAVPTCTGPVTQLWAGYGKVFGVHPGGLFVFDEKESNSQCRAGEGEGESRPPTAVLGDDHRGGLACASFDGAGDRLLLMSANHPPRVFSGV